MLNDQQLNQLFDKLDVPPNGRALVQQIRAGNPVRNVEGRAGNVACRYPSKKMGVTIQAESHKNELAAIYLWEHDDRTYEYYDQPSQIKVRYHKPNGRQNAHLTTPDFFVIQQDFIGWVECKQEEWLIEKEKSQSALFVRDQSMTWQCPPAQEYAKAYGLGFRLRSSAQNPALYVRNLKFLSDYWNARLPSEYVGAVKALKDRVSREKRVLISELLQDGYFLADVLFYAIAGDEVYVNLHQELLSEPEHTYVYASQEVSIIFNAVKHSAGTLAEPFDSVHALDLVPGEVLTWAGTPFEIKVVNNDVLILQGPDAQLLKMKREKLDLLAKQGEIRAHKSLADMKCVLADIYRSASPDDLAEALNRSNILQSPCLSSGGNNAKVSARTLRNWRQRQKEAESKYGDQIVGLVPRISARGNRLRKVKPRVIEIMREVIANDYATADAKSLTLCWGTARNRCEEENLNPPSEKTFRREIKLAMSGYEATLAREGQRAAYSQEQFYFELDRSTPRHGERPFEIAHIDHTQLDLQLVGTKLGEPLGKPWLSVMLDANTRKVLAFALLFDPPSRRSCIVLLRDCLRRNARVPENIVVDRGSDFNSTYFDLFLAKFGITKKSRPPQKPRFGSVIERFFGISNEQLVHNLRGNNKPLQNPRQMTATHDPRNRAVWTYSEFLPRLEEYLFQIYGELEHPAIGVSPNHAFAVGMAKTGLRTMRVIPMSEELELLCLPSTAKGTAKIVSGKGVKIEYLYYRHVAMRDRSLAGKEVPVRYDPFNLAVGYAFLNGKWQVCESELSGIFQGKTEREVSIIAAEIKGRNSRKSKRRAVNAQEIAKFFIGLDTSQAQLLQRRKDAEQGQQHQAFPSTEASNEQRSPSTDKTEDLCWESFNPSPLGDFQ